MQVKDLMTRDVVTVNPNTLVSEVAAIMHQHHYSGLPVVNESGHVLGTISERDFITADSHLYLPTYIQMLANMDYVQGGNKQLPHVVQQIVGATAKDIMNQTVPYARPETSVEELARMFAEDRANPIPVTDSTNKLMGIISRSDLIKFFSPNEVRTSFVPNTQPVRNIDSQVNFSQSHVMSNFALVAKARANIWLTAGIVLFILGFLVGVVYVANPNILRRTSPGNGYQVNTTP